MTGNFKATDIALSDRSLSRKIRSIYSSGSEAAIGRATELLVNALRNGDDHSRSALGEFFDLPMRSRTDSHSPKIDSFLISSARILSNGVNTRRVENFIWSYKASLPYSRHRLLLERIIRDFVVSRSEVEAMRYQLAEAHTLRADASSKRAALKSIIENMSNLT